MRIRSKRQAERAYRRLGKMVSCRFRYCQSSKNTSSLSSSAAELWVNYRNSSANFNRRTHCPLYTVRRESAARPRAAFAKRGWTLSRKFVIRIPPFLPWRKRKFGRSEIKFELSDPGLAHKRKKKQFIICSRIYVKHRGKFSSIRWLTFQLKNFQERSQWRKHRWCRRIGAKKFYLSGKKP